VTLVTAKGAENRAETVLGVLVRGLLYATPEPRNEKEGRAVMKINRSMLVVVVMMVGALGAMGCKSEEKQVKDTGHNVESTEDSKAATPEDNPAAAPVNEAEATTEAGIEKDCGGYRYWVHRGPPAYRVEPVGAVRAGYFWRPGYYGWSGTDYTWYGGAYYPERVGYRYVTPSWYSVGGRWAYRPGRWYRR
jgi:hypothetical protein